LSSYEACMLAISCSPKYGCEVASSSSNRRTIAPTIARRVSVRTLAFSAFVSALPSCQLEQQSKWRGFVNKRGTGRKRLLPSHFQLVSPTSPRPPKPVDGLAIRKKPVAWRCSGSEGPTLRVGFAHTLDARRPQLLTYMLTFRPLMQGEQIKMPGRIAVR